MKRLIQLFSSIVLLALVACCISSCTIINSDGDIDVITTNTYTVQFDSNGGTSVKSQKTNVLKNAPSTSRTDYLFDGWYLDKTFTNQAKFPLEIKRDTVLYAKWIKLTDKIYCESACLKMWTGNNSSAMYYITPSGFEMDKLASLDYSMQIKVSYNVHYVKDYNVPLDIGYAGAPKYEIYILNQDGVGEIQENIKTQTSKVAKTATYKSKIVNLKDQRITLTFSTNNIQNLIYFTDIVVEYRCVKN